jgi:hypothetical protein
MKLLLVKILSLLLVISLWSCGNKSNEHEHDHNHEAADADVSGNQELYNEVMKIHDEVMPRMDNIHELKTKLKDRLDKSQNLTQVERMQIDAMVAKLDSAGEGMMIWMREFRPLPDSTGEEKAREYLENEMERVKLVRSKILQAIEDAKAMNP